MKIMIVGESTSRPSGFGKQTKLIAQGLSSRGHDVTVLGTFPVKEYEKPFTEFPIPFQDKKAVDKYFRRIQPDVVLFFGFIGHIAHFLDFPQLQYNRPCVYYPAWEGTSPPPWADQFRKLPWYSRVHLTTFSRNLWGFPGDTIIPHAAQPLPRFSDKDRCRDYMNKLMRTNFSGDDFLILNLDRNSFRKRWDLSFDYLKKILAKNSGNAILVAHTTKDEVKSGGYDLEKLADAYGVRDKVFFTNFSWDKGLSDKDLAYLYGACDIRVTFSMGEGWGQISDDAALCGIPQIAPRHTSLTEVMDDYFLYDCCATCSDASNTLWSLPDVDIAVKRTFEILDDKTLDIYLNVAAKNPNTGDDVFAQWEATLLAAEKAFSAHEYGYLGAGRENDSRLLSDLLRNYFYGGGTVLDFSSTHYFANSLNAHGVYTERIYTPEEFESLSSHYEAGLIMDLDRLVEGEILKKCKWIIASFRRPAKLGETPVDDVQGHKHLKEAGLTRRPDIENFINKDMDIKLEYQIWQASEDTSQFPRGFTK